MVSRNRAVTPTTGRRAIAILGVVFVALAVGWALVRSREGEPLSSTLIFLSLTAAPGLVLLYGWSTLPRSAIHPGFYPLIAGWCLAGIGVMAGLLALYHVLPSDDLNNPYRIILSLTGFASLAGLGVGFHDARARTRARQLDERNRELQRVRAKLEASNERLEQFASAASHDLKEPLRMIASYLTLLEQRYDEVLDDDGRAFVTFAVDGAERLREMIDALLEYSRVETDGNAFEPVDLGAVLADALQNLEVGIEESDAQIDVDDLPVVAGDRRQLRQVFQNLLHNAITYSGDGPPHVRVFAEPDDATWTVSVQDDGIGIPPDRRADVFAVFQRLHTADEHPGTGIGLALCKQIVERHGGRIWVDSEEGIGSTFSFTVPAIDAE